MIAGKYRVDGFAHTKSGGKVVFEYNGCVSDSQILETDRN